MKMEHKQEDYLKKMANIMSHKYSRSLLINSKESDFTINFEDSINLDQDLNYELGLLWFSCFNTIFNINDKNNEFIIRRLDSSIKKSEYEEWKSIKIQPGAYEITDLAKAISKETNGDVEIKADTQTSKCILTLKKNLVINYPPSNFFYGLLGFDFGPHDYNHSPIISKNIIQITNINSINIECDCIMGSYNNGKHANILYSFPSNTVRVGYKIVERMNPPNYLPLCRKNIMDISFRIVDENGNLINFNGEKISMCLHLKQV